MIQIDLAQIERNYLTMGASEFSQLRRRELTAEAAQIYDRELARRPLDLAAQIQERDAAEAAAAARADTLEPANDPKPRLGLFGTIAIGLSLWCSLLTFAGLALNDGPSKHVGVRSGLSMPGWIAYALYFRKLSAWQQRRNERERQWDQMTPSPNAT